VVFALVGKRDAIRALTDCETDKRLARYFVNDKGEALAPGSVLSPGHAVRDEGPVRSARSYPRFCECLASAESPSIFPKLGRGLLRRRSACDLALAGHAPLDIGCVLSTGHSSQSFCGRPAVGVAARLRESRSGITDRSHGSDNKNDGAHDFPPNKAPTGMLEIHPAIALDARQLRIERSILFFCSHCLPRSEDLT